ncbi:hypothetical protein [Rhizobium leguminosarum]|uniref:Ankyrin repeat domain-containing protein n=1 Tax=Rhizobium leguminosarum TaxID=384 RepID=A0A7K3VG59_RHILE|nr:hypothetical protein [Rhizobium leguminosarum]NEK15061.1 hypothetical protein [Rhizobium leguminosarum]
MRLLLLWIFSIMLMAGAPASAQTSVKMQAPAINGDNNTVIYGNNNTVIYGAYDLRNAIINFNPAVIRDYAIAGNVDTISAVFQEPGMARKFLEMLKSSGETPILAGLLKRGLNPNLLVKAPDSSSETLEVAAFMSGNADAMVELLERGALPHGYQDLPLDPTARPFFIYPIYRVLNDQRFSTKEKEKIVAAMMKQGVLLDASESSPKVAKTTAQAFELAKRNSINQGPSVSDCPEKGLNAKCVVGGPICTSQNSVPKRISQKPGSFRYSEYENLDLIGSLGVFAGREYYLYLAPQGWSGHLVLAEYSADRATVNLMKYQSDHMAGMGVCKAEPDGYIPDECWRSLQVEIDRESGDVALSGSSTFTATFCN